MANPMQQLIHRNIQEIFGEGDGKRRRAAIEALYAEDGVVHVPPGSISGHAAIDKFAGELRATHPHFVYTHIGEAQVLHDAVRQRWGSGPRGAAFAYTGEDIAIVRDGRIAALYVFLDAPPQ